MRFGGLIAAIVFAAIAAVIVLRMSASEAPAPATGQQTAAPMKTVNVYVAATPISIGTTISAEMLAVQPWPEHLVLDGFVKSDGGANLVGMVARSPFQQQEPIILSKLANLNDPNFLAGELPKGMRVITIQTSEIEGLAGFVFPGDHVDVIMTHDVEKWVSDPATNGHAPAPHREVTSVTETLLTNVKVLAVDQRASGANATDKDGKLIVPRSVSLMVSPTDAQRLRLGQKMGTLTLSLRALADRESADPLTITGSHDISQYPETGAATGGGVGGVTVIRGTTSAEISGSAPAQPQQQAAPQVPSQPVR